ncbi:MAG: LysR family transcriptional regulator [Candidatus Nitronauta litoralis]|uniref:LysR family transcriptional regulator n=1 Tax=Candidatus Nitronauta litoralis TaxID=2705533 RepID=A0A7T0FZN0_9BACT|nr:MAG: LysR family transcriptional regulator [Candidatus Nitronauta litoralis]
MYNLPNFRHLYYFWAIAREGSIKKAGKKLNLTPSGLSEQLRLLEENFDKRLFERKARKLILNDTGKLVFEYCNKIFNLAEELNLAVKQENPKRRSRIRVGVLPSLSSSHIHEFVVPLLKDKSVSVVVIEGVLDELIYQLDQNELEMVLSDREVDKKYKKITNYRLRPRKIVAVGSEKFAYLRKNFPHSLSGAPLFQLTRHSQIQNEIESYFYQNQINPQVIGEADDVTLLRLGAERGICVAVLPQNTVTEALSQKKLIRLGELKGISSDMWAMVRADSAQTPIINKTIKRFLSAQ